ncbi:MAG: signal peptide peptidase SppA [Gammaproteobacteria bacterium]|nr:signal peptide peptidase SppA [Gammaproteobacteria bacterium]
MSETPIQEEAPTENRAVKRQERKNVLLQIYRAISATFRFIRVSIANLLIVLLLFIVIVAVSSGDPGPVVQEGSVLVFEPKQALVEKSSSSDPVLDLLLSGYGVGETNVNDVVKALRHAATDENIAMLEIRPHQLLGASYVHLEMIGDAIDEFKESGKEVVSYSNLFTQSQYLLASYADRVAMHPFGDLLFTGFAFENQYFYGLLEKLRISVHIWRAGDFKSAVEPYTRDSMSPEVKASYEPILDQLWGTFLAKIGENRALEDTRVRTYANDMANLISESNNDFATIAVDQGFVDELLGPEQYTQSVLDDLDSSRRKPPRISIEDYLESLPFSTATVSREDSSAAENGRTGRIGLVKVQGAIFDLPFGAGADIGANSSVVDHIDSAARSGVDAFVLRINSPGGSVLASEQIRLALRRLNARGIPIVASMSGTAASGGYWIAAEADEILASSSTITGSIGVFAMIPSVEKALAEVGVHTDGVYSAENARRLDPIAGVKESDSILMQAMVDNSYQRFLNIVSEGRNMEVADVEAIAGGRIWTGEQALERNLIDQIGGIDAAFERAAELAGLSSWRVREYKDAEETLFSMFMSATGWEAPISSPRLRRLVNESNRIVDQILPYFEPRRVYAFCEPCTSSFSL